jgi:phosphoglycolate phosphatase-like HAD superfamily hydrolase
LFVLNEYETRSSAAQKRHTEGFPMSDRPIVDLKAMKELRPALFLDDGGVLNDNALRPAQYLTLIGEFLPPRLGATAELWRDANRAAAPAAWRDIVARLPEFKSHREFHLTYGLDWMKRMCDGAGVALPPEDEAWALFCDVMRYCTERVSSAATGAVEAVRSLQRAGYRLYTASGTTSWELRGIVANMGLSDVFIELYGPDITDRVKFGPAFYEAIFSHARLDSAQALVIESDEEACVYAVEAGAHAVWVDADGRGDVDSLAEVAAALL